MVPFWRSVHRAKCALFRWHPALLKTWAEHWHVFAQSGHSPTPAIMYYPSDTWVPINIPYDQTKLLTHGCASGFVCAFRQSNQRLLHWLPSRKNVGSMGSQFKPPVCPLPKNQSSKSVKSHALVITCVHIIFKKSNKSIPWFIRIDFISD